MVGRAFSDYLLYLYDKVRRKTPSYTWTQWAQEADIPLTTLTRLKNGTTPDPQFGTVCRVLKPVGGSMDEFARFMEGEPLEEEKPSEATPEAHVEVIRAAQADTAQRYSEALVREGEERKRAYDNHIKAMDDQIRRLETHNVHLRTTLYITLGFLIAALIALVVVMISNQQAEIVEEIAEMAGMGKAA